jgi:large subunit ribosomal protein L21
MYAVIRSGGKQYRVSPGQTLKVEKLPAESGQVVKFNEVLLVSDGEKSHFGAPLIANAEVTAEVVQHGRGKKIKIIKMRRRKHHMKHQGHRQYFTAIKVTGINAHGIKQEV